MSPLDILVAEYVHSNTFGRPHVLCRDADDSIFQMIGYFDESPKSRRNREFDARVAPHIKPGHTLELRSGEKKTFAGPSGSASRTIKDQCVPFLLAIPTSQDDVLSAADALLLAERDAGSAVTGKVKGELPSADELQDRARQRALLLAACWRWCRSRLPAAGHRLPDRGGTRPGLAGAARAAPGWARLLRRDAAGKPQHKNNQPPPPGHRSAGHGSALASPQGPASQGPGRP